MTTQTSEYLCRGEHETDQQINSISIYVGTDSGPDYQQAMTMALWQALRTEVDGQLPDGWIWTPDCGQLIGPAHAVAPDLGEILDEAWEAVVARWSEIEASVMPVLPVRAALDALPDDPIDRARAAGRLAEQIEQARDQAAAARRAAIHDATRVMSYEQVAQELGVTVSAINKAVSWHRTGRRPGPR